jgi:CheY-like chemotaxis protein
VLPVVAGASVAGALVVGVSRLLALDRSYRDFLQLVVAQVSRRWPTCAPTSWSGARVAELAALDHAKTAFFSNVSHEFRTPLTLILGPLEDLLDDPELPAAARERLRPMHRNGMRLLKLVNTVLDFSRLESGRMRADYRPTDLADYTAGWPARSARPPSGPGCELDVDARRCPRRSTSTARCGRRSSQPALQRGQVHPGRRDRRRVRADGRRAVLTCATPGSACRPTSAAALRPLPPGDRRLVAQPRGHRHRPGAGPRAGRAARRHGDRARASRARQRLHGPHPARHGHLPAERILDEAPSDLPRSQSRLYVEEAHWWLGETAPARCEPGEVHAGRRGRVLLGDDNADLRDHVARLLRPSLRRHPGDRTVQEALELALVEQFDLVLTDVMMPRLDGFGLIKALRAGRAHPGRADRGALRPGRRGGLRRGPLRRRGRLPGQAVLGA